MIHSAAYDYSGVKPVWNHVSVGLVVRPYSYPFRSKHSILPCSNSFPYNSHHLLTHIPFPSLVLPCKKKTSSSPLTSYQIVQFAAALQPSLTIEWIILHLTSPPGYLCLPTCFLPFDLARLSALVNMNLYRNLSACDSCFWASALHYTCSQTDKLSRPSLNPTDADENNVTH